jgi:hypothetical protein
MAIALTHGYTPMREEWFPKSALEPGRSVRRVAVVFFAAGGVENRHRKDGDNHGNNKKRGRDVHGAGLLAGFRVANLAISFQLSAMVSPFRLPD